MSWTGNEYAAMNLRTIKENIHTYATYADNWPYGELHDKVEAVQESVEELIKLIENS